MSKILFVSNPNTSGKFEAIYTKDTSKKLNVIYGFNNIFSHETWKLETVSNLLSLLLIYDKIAITIWDIKLLVNIFGLEDINILLNEDIFEVIADDNFLPILKINDKKYEAIFVSSLGKDDKKDGGFSNAEIKLLEEYPNERNKISEFIVKAEKNRIDIVKNMDSLLKDESNYDLNNSNITELYGIKTDDISKIHENDIYKILRLLHANKNLIYASEIKADDLVAESEIKTILKAKITPSLRDKNDSKSLFEDILAKKGLPNIGELYLKKILSIQEILDLRNNFHGKLFRKWFYSKEYNEKEVYEGLLNRKINKPKELLVKAFRFILPKAITLIEPITGFLASAANSFLVDKILRGWNPNIFLDEKLKYEIDNKINSYESERRKQFILERFPNTGRNDICPCGSGKKFKNCHGK